MPAVLVHLSILATLIASEKRIVLIRRANRRTIIDPLRPRNRRRVKNDSACRHEPRQVRVDRAIHRESPIDLRVSQLGRDRFRFSVGQLMRGNGTGTERRKRGEGDNNQRGSYRRN